MTGNDSSDQQQSTTVDSRPHGPFTLWMVVVAIVVILDQLTKWAIMKWVPLYDKIPVNSFINITHHQNEGAAFSFLADAGGWQRWFFTLLAIAVSSFIVAWLWRLRRERQFVLPWALVLVLGGAIGNVVDRIRLGYVVDYMQVLIAGWPFPSFNVADAAISVGAVLLIVDALFISGRSGHSADSASTGS